MYGRTGRARVGFAKEGDPFVFSPGGTIVVVLRFPVPPPALSVRSSLVKRCRIYRAGHAKHFGAVICIAGHGRGVHADKNCSLEFVALALDLRKSSRCFSLRRNCYSDDTRE